MGMGMKVSASGPLFDASGAAAKKDLDDALQEWIRNLATTGAADLRATQDVTFKHQTPYYRPHTLARATPPTWTIGDGGIIYGHWLEGDGSRNFPKTRFKGYSLFRKAVQKINARAVNIGQPIVARYVGKINGV